MVELISSRHCRSAPLCLSCHTLITEDISQPIAKTELEIDIDRLSYGPYGIGRSDGKAVMIPNSAPGDAWSPDSSNPRNAMPSVRSLDIIAPSPLRQTPPCPYVGDCGGCTWQHIALPRATQGQRAERRRRPAAHRQTDDFELRPIMPAQRRTLLRRRIRLQVSAVKRLGFYSAASHIVVEVDTCLIAAQPLERGDRAAGRLARPARCATWTYRDRRRRRDLAKLVVSATARRPVAWQAMKQLCERLVGWKRFNKWRHRTAPATGAKTWGNSRSR